MTGEFARILAPQLVAGRRPVAGAVYGTVSVVAVIAGAAHGKESAARVLGFAAVSSLVIWAVHVYSSVLADAGPNRMSWGAALHRGLRNELGVLEGALVPLLVLLLGAVGLVDDERAIWWSMISGVVLLVLLPLVWLRRVATPWWKSLLASAAGGFLGLVLVWFKVILH